MLGGSFHFFLSVHLLFCFWLGVGIWDEVQIFLLDNNALNDFPAEVLQGCLELTTLSIHWNQLTMDDLRKVVVDAMSVDKD